MRQCSKPRCRSRASLTVSLAYADREIHVGELSSEPDPALVDLCSEHARALTPPIGWRIVWRAAPERVGV